MFEDTLLGVICFLMENKDTRKTNSATETDTIP